MRWPPGIGCLVALLASVRGAAAAEPDDAPFEVAPAERRSGFSFGIAGGLSLSRISGFPNDVTKIGFAEFEADTGLGVSTGGALWLGGALTDWLTIGVGLLGGSMEGNGLTASGGSFHARIESFPLFYRGGPWRDLGVLFTAGTGGYEVKRGDETVAEGQGTSAVGTGVFFEPWRFWQFSAGPQLEYSHHFSRSLSAHTLLLGWRMALYAGP